MGSQSFWPLAWPQRSHAMLTMRMRSKPPAEAQVVPFSDGRGTSALAFIPLGMLLEMLCSSTEPYQLSLWSPVLRQPNCTRSACALASESMSADALKTPESDCVLGWKGRLLMSTTECGSLFASGYPAGNVMRARLSWAPIRMLVPPRPSMRQVEALLPLSLVASSPSVMIGRWIE